MIATADDEMMCEMRNTCRSNLLMMAMVSLTQEPQSNIVLENRRRYGEGHRIPFVARRIRVGSV